MKKYLLTFSLIALGLLFSGCADKTIYPIKPNSISGGADGTMQVGIHKDRNLSNAEFNKSENNNLNKRTYKANNLMLKQALELISKKTLEEGKTNFILVNNDTNNLVGFPFNTYNDLNKYCLNYDRNTSLEINCSVFEEFYEINRAVFKFVILDTVDYRIASFDAKKILEELSKEPK